MKITNRTGSNLKRKKLTVVGNILYDNNGEIKELTVDMERADVGLVTSGTNLNAINLETLIKRYYIPSYDSSWQQNKNASVNTLIIDIDTYDVDVDVSGVNTSLISVTKSDPTEEGVVRLTIVETSTLQQSTGSSSTTLSFNVSFKIKNTSTVIGKETISIVYTYQTENQVD